jgi:hypothetical protein
MSLFRVSDHVRARFTGGMLFVCLMASVLAGAGDAKWV